MANPFPPPFYSINRPAARKLTTAHRSQPGPAGNVPQRSGASVLIAIGKTRTGVNIRLYPRALG